MGGLDKAAKYKVGPKTGKPVPIGTKLLDKRFLKKYQNINKHVDKLKASQTKNLSKTKHSLKIGPLRFKGWGPSVLPMERLENDAKNAVRYRIGNCGECASLAFVMLTEYEGPGPDRNLPVLAENREQRPHVWKVALSGSGDHAFVLLFNSTAAKPDLTKTDWLTRPDIIVCDPWWFHLGDAYIVSSLVNSQNPKLLHEHIFKYITEMKVYATARLGDGHSARFKKKYKNLNYYKNTVEDSKKILGVKSITS